MGDYVYTPPPRRSSAISSSGPLRFEPADDYVPLDQYRAEESEDNEEPGWLRKTGDRALTFLGNVPKLFSSVPRVAGEAAAQLYEPFAKGASDNADENYVESLTDPDMQEAAKQARAKLLKQQQEEQDLKEGKVSKSAAEKFMSDIDYEGVGDAQDAYDSKKFKDEAYNGAQPTNSRAVRAWGGAQAAQTEQQGEAYNEHYDNQAWLKDLKDTSAWYAQNKAASDAKIPEVARNMSKEIGKVGDFFDDVGDFILDFRSEFAKRESEGMSQMFESLDNDDLFTAACKLVKYTKDHPGAAMDVALESAPSILAMLFGTGYVLRGPAFAKYVNMLETMHVPKWATYFLTSNLVAGTWDGVITAVQDTGEMINDLMKQGKRITPEAYWGMLFENFASTTAYDALTMGITPMGKFISKRLAPNVAQQAAKQLVGPTAEKARHGLARTLFSKALGLLKGAGFEGAQEAGQSELEQIIENQYSDKPWNEKMTSTMLQGGLVGGLMGGVFHMLGGHRSSSKDNTKKTEGEEDKSTKPISEVERLTAEKEKNQTRITELEKQHPAFMSDEEYKELEEARKRDKAYDEQIEAARAKESEAAESEEEEAVDEEEAEEEPTAELSGEERSNQVHAGLEALDDAMDSIREQLAANPDDAHLQQIDAFLSNLYTRIHTLIESADEDTAEANFDEVYDLLVANEFIQPNNDQNGQAGQKQPAGAVPQQNVITQDSLTADIGDALGQGWLSEGDNAKVAQSLIGKPRSYLGVIKAANALSLARKDAKNGRMFGKALTATQVEKIVAALSDAEKAGTPPSELLKSLSQSAKSNEDAALFGHLAVCLENNITDPRDVAEYMETGQLPSNPAGETIPEAEMSNEEMGANYRKFMAIGLQEKLQAFIDSNDGTATKEQLADLQKLIDQTKELIDKGDYDGAYDLFEKEGYTPEDTIFGGTNVSESKRESAGKRYNKTFYVEDPALRKLLDGLNAVEQQYWDVYGVNQGEFEKVSKLRSDLLDQFLEYVHNKRQENIETAQRRKPKEAKEGEKRPANWGPTGKFETLKPKTEELGKKIFTDQSKSKKSVASNQDEVDELRRRDHLINNGVVPEHLQPSNIGEELAKQARVVMDFLRQANTRLFGERRRVHGGAYAAGRGIGPYINRIQNLLAQGNVKMAIDKIKALPKLAAAREGRANLGAALSHYQLELQKNPGNKELAKIVKDLDKLKKEYDALVDDRNRDDDKWNKAYDLLNDDPTYRFIDNRVFRIKGESFKGEKVDTATSEIDDDEANIAMDLYDNVDTNNGNENENAVEETETEAGTVTPEEEDTREDLSEAAAKWGPATDDAFEKAYIEMQQLRNSDPEWQRADAALKNAELTGDKDIIAEARKDLEDIEKRIEGLDEAKKAYAKAIKKLEKESKFKHTYTIAAEEQKKKVKKKAEKEGKQLTAEELNEALNAEEEKAEQEEAAAAVPEDTSTETEKISEGEREQPPQMSESKRPEVVRKWLQTKGKDGKTPVQRATDLAERLEKQEGPITENQLKEITDAIQALDANRIYNGDKTLDYHLDTLFGKLEDFWRRRLAESPESYESEKFKVNSSIDESVELEAVGAKDIIESIEPQDRWAKRNVLYLLSVLKANGIPLRRSQISFAVDKSIKGNMDTQAYYMAREVNGKPRMIIALPQENAVKGAKACSITSAVHEFTHAKDFGKMTAKDRYELKSQKATGEVVSTEFNRLTSGWKLNKALRDLIKKHPLIENLLSYPLDGTADFGKLLLRSLANETTLNEEINNERARIQGELHAQLVTGYLTNPEIRAIIDGLDVNDPVRNYVEGVVSAYRNSTQTSRQANPQTGSQYSSSERIPADNASDGTPEPNSRNGVYSQNEGGRDQYSEQAQGPGTEGVRNQGQSGTSGELSGETPKPAQNRPQRLSAQIREKRGQLESKKGKETNPRTAGETGSNDESKGGGTASGVQESSEGRNPVSRRLRSPEQIDKDSKKEAKRSVDEKDPVIRFLKKNFPTDLDHPVTRQLGPNLVAAWKLLKQAWNKLNLLFLAPSWKLAELAKDTIPSVKDLLEKIENHSAIAGHWLENVAIINDAYQHLYTQAERDSVNQFLEQSTLQNKWGYVPDWITEAQKKQVRANMSDELKKKYSEMSKDAQNVVDAVFQQGYEAKKKINELVNNIREEHLVPRKKRFEAQVKRLANEIKNLHVLRMSIPMQIKDLESKLNNTSDSKVKKKLQADIDRLNEQARKIPERLKQLTEEHQAAKRTFDSITNELDKLDNARKKLLSEKVLPYAPLRRKGTYAAIYKSKEYADLQKNIDSYEAKSEGLSSADRENLRKMRKRLEKIKSDPKHYQVSFHDNIRDADLQRQEYERLYPDGKSYAFEREMAGQVKGLSLAERAEISDIIQDKVLNSNLSNVWFGTDEAAIQLTSYITDALNQIFEQAASETVRRDELLKRSKVAGYNENMMESFLQQGSRDAKTVANLSSSREIADSIRQCRKEAQKASREGKEQAMTIFNEILRRHEDSMNRPRATALDSAIENARAYTTFAQLLTRPAYYIQNATQPAMMTFPELAGKYGGAKATTELMQAYSSLNKLVFEHAKKKNIPVWRAGISLSEVIREADLEPGAKEMLQRLADTGKLDLGKETDFGTVNIKGAIGRWSASTMSKFTKVARCGEAINRYVSAIAAYNLEYEAAKKEGLDDHAASTKAADYALLVVDKTQGDYSAVSAPRIFNTRYGKLGLQFKKFTLFQYAWFAGMFHNAFTGTNVSAEERSVARKQLAYAMLTHGFFGVKGLPGGMLALSLYGALGGADDGEDAETTLRKNAKNPDLMDLWMEGVTSYLFDWDLTGMVGAGDMLDPNPFAPRMPWEGRGAGKDYLFAAMGPFVKRMFNIEDALVEGNMEQFLYYFLPNGPVSLYHALADDGYKHPRTGEQLLTEADIGQGQRFLQMFGFSPKAINVMYAKRKILQKKEETYKDIRSKLVEQYTEYKDTKSPAAKAKFRSMLADANKMRKKDNFATWSESDIASTYTSKKTRQKNMIGGVATTKSNRKFVENMDKWRGR